MTITVGGERVPTGRNDRIAEVKTSGSVMSASDKRVHFGLGKAERVERVEVRWLSGVVDVCENVPASQPLVVREGEGMKISTKDTKGH